MLYEENIDYELIASHDIESLKKALVFPLKKENPYEYFVTCKQSDFLFFNNQFYHNSYESSKEEILFVLSDFTQKYELFMLVQKSLHNNFNSSDSTNIFLEKLLDYSIAKRCSDIHLETSQHSLVIRFRIDGILKHFFSFPKNFYPIITSIIKLKASLDITEKRRPLDGRFSHRTNEKKIDFRVSTVPTIHGESIVLRVLDDVNKNNSLGLLGFNLSQLNVLKKSLHFGNGLLLVTGPTGSGKTTTLYSMLKELDTSTKKIITIEDPIEYELKNIQQIAVNDELGLSFNVLLRNILRQDPDIIMVGEIRDKESLQIALQASLTGHLVLSTLHTNSCLETLTRLYDLEAKPYILASTLKMIMAQRLVLKLCNCEGGCERCNYTNYKGRVSISEVLTIDESLSSLISEQASLETILMQATKNGFIPITKDAQKKIQQKITTDEEVFRVLGGWYE